MNKIEASDMVITAYHEIDQAIKAQEPAQNTVDCILCGKPAVLLIGDSTHSECPNCGRQPTVEWFKLKASDTSIPPIQRETADEMILKYRYENRTVKGDE